MLLKKTCVSLFLQELPGEELVGLTTIQPAKAGVDFPEQQGWLTFDLGKHDTSLDVHLTPNLASSSHTPKRFQVELRNATGGARVHSLFGRANVTLVADVASEALWLLLDQLHQPLDAALLNRVLRQLIMKVTTPLTHEQMAAVLEAMGKVKKKKKSDNYKNNHFMKSSPSCDTIINLHWWLNAGLTQDN